MLVEKPVSSRRIYLEPGGYFASREPCVISTLLGSCVAACLFDPVHQVIGMNHFMLSRQSYAKDFIIRTEAGRYGVHAMELLINEMLKLGAEKKYLRAKAFGGSSLLGNKEHSCSEFLTVGKVNCRFIREFLELEDIPLVSESLGGAFGRTIHFFHRDFAVYMRKIKSAEKERNAAHFACACAKKNGLKQPRLHIPHPRVVLWK